jgi:hypothetical protein
MTLTMGYLSGRRFSSRNPDRPGRHPDRRRNVAPFIYWATIIASTTVGRRWPTSPTARLESAMPGLGRVAGPQLMCSRRLSTRLWYRSEGQPCRSTDGSRRSRPRVEPFYWADDSSVSQYAGTGARWTGWADDYRTRLTSAPAPGFPRPPWRLSSRSTYMDVAFRA